MRLTVLLATLTLILLRPVGPPPPEIVRGWEPPPGPYAAGHRGIDLAAPPGTPVLAPAAGTVTFAGPVGGRGAVSLTLPGTGTPPLRTTFTPVTPLVPPGTRVARGTPIAEVAEGPHCRVSCLHWGLLRGKEYLNPLLLTRRAPARLLPLDGEPWGAGRAGPGSRPPGP
ncbi:M23 family metallopeptidase [Streptomyces sp. NPDC090303]|uniref:M23 family metallopeptidase n=1 Tax=Streptomyces sp. NPDC090303 TaxID=3365960 RepID=UPI0038166310